MASAIRPGLAANPKASGLGAIHPTAIWRVTPASTISVLPDTVPMTIRARGCSIPRRMMTTTTTWISIRTTSTVTATATTPDRFCSHKQQRPLQPSGRLIFENLIRKFDAGFPSGQTRGVAEDHAQTKETRTRFDSIQSEHVPERLGRVLIKRQSS